MNPYVIVGNGVAAAGCIEGIRSIDKHTPITVISEENHPVYCRPLISYYLEGKTEPGRMNYRPDDFYDRMGCTVLYGRSAVKIRKHPKHVVLDDGSELPWSKLCIATGSRPFVPPMEGLDTVTEQFRFMTIDDAQSILKALHKDSRVLIVGAGLIGLKCAEGIYPHAGQITVCDLADRVLSSILDKPCAALMQKQLEEKGIAFLLSDSVARFDGRKAWMTSGKKVDFDILVLAVGVKANLSLVKDAGGETNRGIVVNEQLKTSLPDIYAAGDCCEGYDLSLKANRVLAILPNAYMQGHAAGVNMAGGIESFKNGIPIGFFGLHAMTAGTYYTAEQGGECYEESADGKIRRFYTKDGFLTGFILIGETERAGIYTSLIREQVPLSQVDFEMLKNIATSAAFSPTARKQKFSTRV